MSADWHLQVCCREWVLWGYGPQPHYTHIEPANVHVQATKDVEFDIPFDLPKPEDTPHLPAPQEDERRVCWGWRFRTNNYVHDCGWHLAETHEEMAAAAKIWAEEQDQRSPDVRHGWVQPLALAILDIREYPEVSCSSARATDEGGTDATV